MERQQIEIFLTLARELHFGRTAEMLRLSQARVSQSVKASEREIGAALFVRTSRRVQLTPLGAQLREDLEPAYANVTTALHDAAESARRANGRIKVGFLGPLAGDLLVASVPRFRARHPSAYLELHATEIADPLRPLRDEQVDLVLTQLPVAESGTTSSPALLKERRVLAVSSRHRLAQQASVTLEDLALQRLPLPSGTPARDWLDTYQPWTTPSGLPIERGPAVATFGELMSLIAAGECVCTVAAHNATYHPRPGVTYLPIDDAPPFEFGLVWRTETETALLRALVATVQNTVDKLGGPERAAINVRLTGRLE